MSRNYSQLKSLTKLKKKPLKSALNSALFCHREKDETPPTCVEKTADNCAVNSFHEPHENKERIFHEIDESAPPTEAAPKIEEEKDEGTLSVNKTEEKISGETPPPPKGFEENGPGRPESEIFTDVTGENITPDKGPDGESITKAASEEKPEENINPSTEIPLSTEEIALFADTSGKKREKRKPLQGNFHFVSNYGKILKKAYQYRYAIAASFIAILIFYFFFACSRYVFARSCETLSLSDEQYIASSDVIFTMEQPALFKNVRFFLDKKDVTQNAQNSDGKINLKLENLSEGSHTLTIGYSNFDGPASLMTGSRTVRFIVDTTAPAIKITNPDNDIIYKRDITIEGQTEPKSNIVMEINDRPYTVSVDEKGEFSKKIFLDQDKNHLKIEVTDPAGNKSTLEKDYILDCRPPMIKIIYPKAGQTINENNTTVKVKIFDSGSGIGGYYFEFEGKKYKGYYNPSQGILSTNLKNLDEGLYEIKVFAFDQAKSESKTEWSFIVNSLEEPGSSKIRPGALGADVKIIQKLLSLRGALKKNQITGVYDSPTINAIMEIQRKKNLPVTGITDRKTLMLLSNKIFVYLNEYALFLVSPDDKVLKKYPIACGSPYYPTPTGRFTVKEKVYYPAWYPPDSPWARGAKPIPPGPGNPLGTRWIGLSGGGVGIHGTSSPWSIGSAASHGCIRMYIQDVEELYDFVNIGMQVEIFSGRPAEHRKYQLSSKKNKSEVEVKEEDPLQEN